MFSEPNRLAVLDALRQGPLNVTAVVERTGLSQALVSKHLKLLTIAGVVKRRPEGSLACQATSKTEPEATRKLSHLDPSGSMEPPATAGTPDALVSPQPV
ncbi:MAG: metalloregulator ArsR/SmtB family transcription factor, partial [Cyanobium sp.]|nr:metalloregulator ArsR/SmtB family transcription factor [Cyanobium sp.]